MKLWRCLLIFLGMTIFTQAVSVETRRVARAADIQVGRIDAVYPAESRIIVGDSNYVVGKRSQLFDLNGRPVFVDGLEVGTIVKIKRSPSSYGNTYMVETLRIITDYQADTVIESMREEME